MTGVLLWVEMSGGGGILFVELYEQSYGLHWVSFASVGDLSGDGHSETKSACKSARVKSSTNLQ